MSLKDLELLVTAMEEEEHLQTKLQLYSTIQDKYKSVGQSQRKLLLQMNDYKPKKKRERHYH